MEATELLAKLPNATLPTEVVLRMLSIIGSLPNSTKSYPVWAEVNRLLIEQAKEKPSADA